MEFHINSLAILDELKKYDEMPALLNWLDELIVNLLEKTVETCSTFGLEAKSFTVMKQLAQRYKTLHESNIQREMAEANKGRSL